MLCIPHLMNKGISRQDIIVDQPVEIGRVLALLPLGLR